MGEVNFLVAHGQSASAPAPVATAPVRAASGNTLQSRVGAMVSAMATFGESKGRANVENGLDSDLTRVTSSHNVHVAVGVTSMVNVLNQFNEQGKALTPLVQATTASTTLNLTDPLQKHALDTLADKKR
jgi:hypothetical protein